MSELEAIPFERSLGHQTRVFRIEWWQANSRFVVVRYTRRGEIVEFGMRLDLDKRAFLDRFDDESLDDNLQALIPEISNLVSASRGSLRPVSASGLDSLHGL